MPESVALDRPLPPRVAAPTAASRGWSCARYLEALHPPAGRGKVSFLARQHDTVTAHTCDREEALAAADVLLESDAAYVAINPYHGPRGGNRRLATLNAVFLDLDVHRVPALAWLSRAAIAGQITARIAALGLPPASVTIDSGRGFYAVWLLDGGHPDAEPRWRAATRALVGLFAGFGADPACVDPARVLRLPESWHEGAGRMVTIVSGDGARHHFDTLCNRIFVAAGRPTREALAARRAGRTPRSKRAQQPAAACGPGLTRRAFWAAVQRDLGRLLAFWGGTAPVGSRDLWLHFHACALAWADPGADIAEAIVALAADAAPGLSSREVRTCVGTVVRRARDAVAGRHGTGGGDPRYGYGGATIAERLAIDAGLAARLGLEQIIPNELRAARRARARTAQRRAAGALPRAIWLAMNPISRERPWEAEGISRATWYRRLKERRDCHVRALLTDLRTGAAIMTPCRETGLASLYEGEAPLGGTADEPLSPAIPARRANLPPSRPRPTLARPPRAIPRQNAVRSSPTSAQAQRAEPLPTNHAITTDLPVKTPPHPKRPEAAKKETIAMPAPLDPANLAAAAARLGPSDLGWLVRILSAPDGATTLATLDPEHRARLAPWLQCNTNDAIIGIRVPDTDPAPTPRPAARDIHGDLFGLVRSRPCVAPPSIRAGAPAGGHPPTVKQTAIAEGVRLLIGAGKSEDSARRIVGALFRDLRDGVVCEAIAAASARAHEIAEPVGWMRAYATRNYGTAANRLVHRPPSAKPVVAAPQVAQSPRPLATPEALGISSERARNIREKNRLLAIREGSAPRDDL